MKNKLSKKLHNAKKRDWWILWAFPFRFFLSKNMKKRTLLRKIEGGPFEVIEKIFKKSLTMPKKLKRGPFGIFQYPFCRKTSKRLKGSFSEFFSSPFVLLPPICVLVCFQLKKRIFKPKVLLSNFWAL